MLDYVDSEAVGDGEPLWVGQVSCVRTKAHQSREEKSSQGLDWKGHQTEPTAGGGLGVPHCLTFLSGLISGMFLR